MSIAVALQPVSWQRMGQGIDDVKQRLERAAAASMDVFLDGPDAKVRDAVHILWAGEKAVPDAIEPTPELHGTESADAFELVPLEDLVRMKLTSFRDKDRIHLRDPISVDLVDASWLARYKGSLAERLQMILDDPER